MRKYDSKKDYYKILGVREDADQGGIDRAFRNRARKAHPDGGGSEEDMKLLNEARDILSDPEARKAYDAERRPRLPAYRSSMAFDPEAASRAGTLKVPVPDEDYVGLLLGAATCIGVGLPLLLLVEGQWVFFLWPLRMLSLGAVVLGVVLAHSALSQKYRRLKKLNPALSRRRFVFYEAVFWAAATTFLSGIIYFLYIY
ncbi:MAG TPA: DnaJ domain-containing protein [Blastocatellia bacterium]|nr:DnaJ domain-containing protein [Blastocatellia bacterium]